MKASQQVQLNKKTRSLAPFIINLVVCSGLFAAVLIAFVINYKVPAIVSTNANFWDIVHAEFVEISSILPFTLPAISYYLIKWINPEYPKLFRGIWPALFALLIIYYRLAIDMEMHRVLMAIVGYGYYLLTVFLALLFDKIHKDGLSQDSGIARRALVKALGNEIRNQNILSVQLFECERTKVTAGNISFKLINKAHLANTRNDVNSILVLNLEMPYEDFNQFGVSLNVFEKVVENGAVEEDKIVFKKAIEQKKDALKKSLSSRKPENITKRDSCLARLLMCYTMLEQMVDQPVQAVLELSDGELGLDVELEKALFSKLRTGMLGAILFQAQRRYYFRYRKDGYKVGRKYCAFLLDPEIIKEKSGMDIENLLICLITIRENSTNHISTDIIEWINRAEKKIVREYSSLLKGTG